MHFVPSGADDMQCIVQHWRLVESANTATTGNVQCANVLSEVVGG